MNPLKALTVVGAALANGVVLPHARATTLHSSIASYHVDTQIQSRFATTVLTVDFINHRNCSTVRTFTLQLPLNARVASLSMDLSDGCSLNSTVETVANAEQTFHNASAAGQPAALLTAWDSTDYQLAVSLSPWGNTTVMIEMEELLARKRGSVEFQIPISPGVPVDRITAHVVVSEPETGVERFSIDVPIGLAMSTTSHDDTLVSASLEALNVDGNALPRLIRGEYDTGDLPEDGLLITDGSDCIVHLFNPPSMQDGIPRNIVFVIDVSGSMSGQKLVDTKKAFASMMQMLNASDVFAIHSFSNDGMERTWGPRAATPSDISDATSFVQNLVADGSTNLNDAYTDGIGKVKEMQAANSDLARVPIMVILTDGQPTAGVTNAPDIAQNVMNANIDVEAKIFALAFGEGADLALLHAIAIQNGGIAVQIYEGYGDADVQMENFVASELGTVVLYDIAVSFEGDVPVNLKTKSSFPVLAKGSENAILAKVEATTDNTPTSIRAITTAKTGSTGSALKNWNAELQWIPSSGGSFSECRQSLAHAKITELLRFRDAALKIGDAMSADADEYLSPTAQSRDSLRRASGSPSLADMAEAEALRHALESGVVWPGLTALVTTPNEACDQASSENEVCTEGDEVPDESTLPEEAGDIYQQRGSTSASPSALFLHHFVLTAGIVIFVLFCR